MPRERTSLTKLADRQLDAGARESDRYLDLQLDFFDEQTGEWFARFGGRWDRVEKEYAGEAQRSRAVRFHAGQIEPARWFDDWIGCYLANDFGDMPRIYDSVLYGGRRSGKSHLGWAIAIAFALTVPGALVFVVVPSESYYNEPAMELEAAIPREWYEPIGDPPTYLFPNGSQIAIRSGHIPRLLKQGRVDLVIIHEGQALGKQSYDTISASIVDTGGLIVTTCNPPDVGDPGEWVAEVVTACERGDRKHAVSWFLDPELNPHVDQQALRALAEKYDKHTYDVQIRGKILLTPDTVLHEWDRRDNERPAPAMPSADCTREFTKFFEGFELDDIVSIDVQSYPWLVGVRWRAYRNPIAPHDMERAFLWGVGEAFIEKGDEIDLANEMIAMGCGGLSTLVVMDASCDWQQAEREADKQRTTFRGKGSMDMIRACGFRHVVPPDQRMKANPDIADRCRAANSRICTATGQRHVFIDPKLCTRSVDSIRKWKTRPNGMPSRSAKAAHAGDAITYAIWRFFPRRGEKSKVEATKVPRRIASRDRLKGI